MSEILVKVGQLRRLGIPCPEYRIWEMVMEHNFRIFSRFQPLMWPGWASLPHLLGLKFRYSEKASFETNLPNLFDITYLVTSQKMGDFFQNFVAFSEYLNFTFFR